MLKSTFVLSDVADESSLVDEVLDEDESVELYSCDVD